MLRIRDQGREARDRIGKSGGQVNKRKNPHKRCTHDVENGGDLGGNRKKCRQESVGSVTADPYNQENSNEAGRETQRAQGPRRTVRVERECFSFVVSDQRFL